MQISAEELHAGVEFDRLLHLEIFDGAQTDDIPKYTEAAFGKVLRRIAQRVTPLGSHVGLVSMGHRWRAFVGEGIISTETADAATPAMAICRLAVKVFLS